MSRQRFSQATHAAAIGVGDTVLDGDTWREVTGSDLTGDEVTLILDGRDEPWKGASDDRLQRSLGLMSDC